MDQLPFTKENFRQALEEAIEELQIVRQEDLSKLCEDLSEIRAALSDLSELRTDLSQIARDVDTLVNCRRPLTAFSAFTEDVRHQQGSLGGFPAYESDPPPSIFAQ